MTYQPPPPSPAEVLLKKKLDELRYYPDAYFRRLHEFEMVLICTKLAVVGSVLIIVLAKIFHWEILLSNFMFVCGGLGLGSLYEWYLLDRVRSVMLSAIADLAGAGHKIGVDVSGHETKLMAYLTKPHEDIVELKVFGDLDLKELRWMLDYGGYRYIQWYQQQKGHSTKPPGA